MGADLEVGCASYLPVGVPQRGPPGPSNCNELKKSR